MELIIESGIPMACILAYLRRTEEAIEAFESILEKVAEDLSEGEAINLASFLEYTVRVCFHEHYEMVNPLVLVFHQDHHRLNLRIQQAIDTLYASVKDSL